jgi:hypothetical protein
MLAKVGALSLIVLVGAEAFVMSAAVLLSAAALAHLGSDARFYALVLSGLLGVAAAVWMGVTAARTATKAQQD